MDLRASRDHVKAAILRPHLRLSAPGETTAGSISLDWLGPMLAAENHQKKVKGKHGVQGGGGGLRYLEFLEHHTVHTGPRGSFTLNYLLLFVGLNL